MRQFRATAEPCPPVLLPLLSSPRAQIEAAIETLIAHLDALDGDPDREPDADDEESDFGEEEEPSC